MAHFTNETFFNVIRIELFKSFEKNPDHTKVDVKLNTSNLYQENNKFDEKYLKEKLESIGLENISIQVLDEYQCRLVADRGTFIKYTESKPINIQDFCNNQIDISLRANEAINSNPLKQLVGYAAYDGNGYSKDFEESGILDMEKLKKINPARQSDSFDRDGKINL